MIFMVAFDLMHKSKHSIFSLLSDATRIHDYDICLDWIYHLAESCRHKDHMDLLAVSIVHLTTEGFYIEGFEHKKFCTMRLALLYRESDFCKAEESTKSVNTS